MFGSPLRTLAIRLSAAAAWLRAFAFLEDGPRPAASDMPAPHLVAATPLRPSAHAHRRRLRPAARARRPGEVAGKPMPCLTPLPARFAPRPAISAGRASKHAISRRCAP